jgi:hypothetical protein
MDSAFIQVLNTSLLSIVTTLAAVIYWDMRSRIRRMDRQIMACLSTLIAIVNHMEPLPEHILRELHEALNSD